MPVINQEKESNGVELAPFGEPIKFYPKIYFNKEDARHLFKGAIHGIMTGQSRTAPAVLAFMLSQYDEIKARKL